MFGYFDSVAQRLVRRGLRRGLIDGNTTWLVVAAAAGLFRLMARRDKPRVITENLALGESVLVRHVAPPERTKRKAKRSDKDVTQ